MKKIKQQFVVTLNEDGTIRITERKLPERNSQGRFIGKRRNVVGRGKCPACGASLVIMKEVA